MTLTTVTDIPWNRPYYVRLGFQVVPENEWTPGQRRIRKYEATLGLDKWPRVVMQRHISMGDSTVDGSPYETAEYQPGPTSIRRKAENAASRPMATESETS